MRRSIHRARGGGLVYEEPKTRRSQRTLARPMPLVAELQRHKAAQPGERMLAGSEWHDEDLVFAQPNSRPIDKTTDYDDWPRLLQAPAPAMTGTRSPAHRSNAASVRKYAPAPAREEARPAPARRRKPPKATA